MADPKYYMDDKAILDMMYQMVYGGQLPPPPDDSIMDEKMKELYEQMTPEQKAKVNAKLREQSVEKIDSAIDSYPGDF